VKTILHVVEMDAAPADLYAAIATGRGLAGWWTTRVTAGDRVGGIIDFGFAGDFNPDMEITALDPPASVGRLAASGRDDHPIRRLAQRPVETTNLPATRSCSMSSCAVAISSIV
jgi:uncharacterized protein YndB with AHSA1/START domain